VSRIPSPTLPTEVLQEIFSLATHLKDDLVSPYWQFERPYAPWVISSQTRRNIPLVCRQWHLVGLEYLYEHIVLFTPSQLFKLLNVFNIPHHNAELHEKYIRWIRGLELIILRHDLNEENEFTLGACDLIYKLSRGRLRVFGFEDGQYYWRNSRNTLEIMRAGIIVSQKSSEALFFPLRDRNSHLVEDGASISELDNRAGDAGTSTEESIGFSKLETLSLIRGGWYDAARSEEDLSFFASHIRSIRTIYLNWTQWTQEPAYLNLLRTAVHLETIHVINGKGHFPEMELDRFLEAVPRLRRLIVTLIYSHHNLSRPLMDNAVVHTRLEEITLIMNSAWGYKNIYVLLPIFSKIQNGHLPGLTRVVVCGPYPNGCLDIGTHDVYYERCWKFAIKTCEEHEVDLVDEEGNAIHLWSRWRGVRFERAKDATDSDTASSEDGEWWEMSASEYNESVLTNEDLTSEESGNSTYRYVSQPDLDYDSRSVR
jgi:F-box-like